MFASHLLKRKNPDRHKVEERFAESSDEALLGAIANPDHSEAARGILRELAERRGLRVGEDLWDLSAASVHVKPFGRRPTFDEALAAPRRRRRLYRAMQAAVVACVALGIAALWHSQNTYERWVTQGVADGALDGALIEGLSAGGMTYETIYQLSLQFEPFAQRLRSTYYTMLIEDLVALEWLDGGEVAQRRSSGQSTEQIIDWIDATTGVPDDLITAEKARAWEAGSKAPVGSGNDDFDALVQANDMRWAEEGVAPQDRFDAFAATGPPFEPGGERSPWTPAVGVLLLVMAVLLWVVVGIFAWTQPYRVLLLRPFQSRAVSRSLKRFVNKNVAFNGHTFTLADKFVKESRLAFLNTFIPRGPEDAILIPLFFIPSVRQFKRWVNVTGSRDYRFLQKRLRRRFTLNMFWLSSYTKVLKVKSSDTWWRACIDLLMFSSHLIVVDLSWVKPGTEWELEKINRRDLENKTVFVVAEENVAYARDVVAKFWPADEPPPELHVYRKSGRLLDREAYERDVARSIAESHLWREPMAAHAAGAQPA